MSYIDLSKAYSGISDLKDTIGQQAYGLGLQAYDLGLAFGRAIDPSPIPSALRDYRSTAFEKYRNYVLGSPGRLNNHQLTGTKYHYYNEVGGRSFESIYLPKKGAKELVVHFTGCKAKAIHWQDQMNILRDRDRSFFVVNSSVPNHETDFVNQHVEMFKRTLLDETSAVHQIAHNEGSKIKLMGHSLGGLTIARGLHDESTANALEEFVDNTVMINPFGGSKSLNADRWFSTIKRWLYEKHAKKHHDKLNGDTFPDLLAAHYSKLWGEPTDIWSSNGPPAHPQVWEMQDAADELKADTRESGFPKAAKRMRTCVVAGEKDKLSDVKCSHEISEASNSTTITIPRAWHSPFHEDMKRIAVLDHALSPKSVPFPSALATITPPPTITQQPRLQETAPHTPPVSAGMPHEARLQM